jgi:two-component system CheB/CheR fusion protein
MAKAQKTPGTDFPIVAIGASAGGLEAFQKFFNSCPVDTGMAFVLISHLAPDHSSLLTEILQRSTGMPVVEALDKIQVKPNNIYIIPPNRAMRIVSGALQLSQLAHAHGQCLPIDGFLTSLASEKGKLAIGIILSGTASDGTAGLRTILAGGGICMVQDPTTAAYSGMPQSAINAGCATHVLAVENMPAKLLKLIRRTNFHLASPPILAADVLSSINQILLQIRTTTGHDFSLYKKSTISRRIESRMAQYGIENMAAYGEYLKKNPAEIHRLFQQLLINVTSFFRDPEAFELLKLEILPALLKDKPDDYEFRIWVAGCASGEEAYSIAMLMRELMDEAHQYFKLQIFATDIDEESINLARSGHYPLSIAHDVSPERLTRFFIQNSHGYKIKKDIRDMVVFAVQSVIKDPPFTRLDLLSCRNLMIYLEAEQQNRLIPVFHYALKPKGVLFISNSESITNQPELFRPLHRKWKFYSAIHTANKPRLSEFRSLAMPVNHKPSSSTPNIVQTSKISEDSIAELSNSMLLQSYAPTSVTTDSEGDILYVHGDISRYLRQPAGAVTTNILKMAHPSLQPALRNALHLAVQGELTLRQEVMLEEVEGLLAVSFSVRPLHIAKHNALPCLLVSFQEVMKRTKIRASKGEDLLQVTGHDEQLARELAYTKLSLENTIQSQQATNEALQSANEELQSTNEELQSSNEELETSREELQSMNEETITINSELNDKVEQLNDIQNDLKNLLDNVNTGVIFLDYKLNIRRYTRDATKVYRLIASDVGRPLGDITSNLEDENLPALLSEVLDTLVPQNIEVRTLEGTWYLLRIQPYRTLSNMIEGLVLSFTDITLNREATKIKETAAQIALNLAEGIVNTISEPLLVLDGSMQVVSASHSFYQHFQVTPENTVGQKIYALGNGQWNIPALRNLLENILPQQQVMEGFVVEHNFPHLGNHRIVLNARRIVTALGDTELILLAMVTVEVAN